MIALLITKLGFTKYVSIHKPMPFYCLDYLGRLEAPLKDGPLEGTKVPCSRIYFRYTGRHDDLLLYEEE